MKKNFKGTFQYLNLKNKEFRNILKNLELKLRLEENLKINRFFALNFFKIFLNSLFFKFTIILNRSTRRNNIFLSYPTNVKKVKYINFKYDFLNTFEFYFWILLSYLIPILLILIPL